jgi:predicted O-methyltransferase YrrM
MSMEESEVSRRLRLERDALLAEREQLLARLRDAGKGDLWVPPGHFYSPIPALAEVLRCQERIFAPPPRRLPGIDLREAEQLALLATFGGHHDEMPWAPEALPGLLYRYENTAFSYADAVFLHCMLRHIAPRRILEAGSGWSTCLMLDCNRRFFGDRIQITAIDPAPATLPQVLRPEDHGRGRLVTAGLQDAPLELFAALEAGDVLFVDSTHVCRIDSDVNRLLFEILPSLAEGVWIHFHDIFHPFEYPRPWVLENRAWNEAYALRAFLQYNQSFEIVLFGSFLQQFHRDAVARVAPKALRSDSGSLWLRKGRSG